MLMHMAINSNGPYTNRLATMYYQGICPGKGSGKNRQVHLKGGPNPTGAPQWNGMYGHEDPYGPGGMYHPFEMMCAKGKAAGKGPGQGPPLIPGPLDPPQPWQFGPNGPIPSNPQDAPDGQTPNTGGTGAGNTGGIPWAGDNATNNTTNATNTTNNTTK